MARRATRRGRARLLERAGLRFAPRPRCTHRLGLAGGFGEEVSGGLVSWLGHSRHRGYGVWTLLGVGE